MRILACYCVIIAALPFSLPAATITVKTIGELTDANGSAAPGDTILINDGTYRIASYGIAVRTNGLTFRSASGIRENVIITGAGMHGDIEYGFWVAADSVTIADLTIQDVYYHCIQTDVNTDGLRVTNCILRDAREQLLKVPYSSDNPDPSENGIVEGCRFYFTKDSAEQYYTGGVDCHNAKNWSVRNNRFNGIRSPDDQLAEHAVHFWTGSEGTVVESNVIINCDRGIGFGLGESPHKGGIIRNNMIYHAAITGIDHGDVGIALETCTNTKVYNNTIYFDNDYPNAIEYRFAATTGVFIANNLANRTIKQRDNASATLAANITEAQASWFRSAADGDLHLLSSASMAIDKGTAIDGLDVDIDGETRRSDEIDVGADEYCSSRVAVGRFENTNHPHRFRGRLVYHPGAGMVISRPIGPLLPNVMTVDPAGRLWRENIFLRR